VYVLLFRIAHCMRKYCNVLIHGRFEIRMQNEVTIWSLIIAPLQMWKNFWYFKTIYDDNLFVIANVKQLLT